MWIEVVVVFCCCCSCFFFFFLFFFCFFFIFGVVLFVLVCLCLCVFVCVCVCVCVSVCVCVCVLFLLWLFSFVFVLFGWFCFPLPHLVTFSITKQNNSAQNPALFHFFLLSSNAHQLSPCQLLTSVCVCVCVSVCLSVRLSVCLSVCLSVYLCHFFIKRFFTLLWSLSEAIKNQSVKSLSLSDTTGQHFTTRYGQHTSSKETHRSPLLKLNGSTAC